MSDALPPQPVARALAETAAAGSSGGASYGRNFWLVFASTFAINSVGYLFVLFPIFIVHLGGGATAIGAIVGTSSLAALLARPGVGIAVERYGRRWTALWFLALNVVALALYIPLASLNWMIYAVAALNGLASGTARVALFAMVYDILPDGRQGEAMATFSLSGQAPASFIPLLGEFILDRFGFVPFFLTAAAISALGTVAVAMVPDDRPPRPRTVTSAAADPAAGYVALLTDSTLATLWVLTFVFGAATSVRNFVAPFAYQQGIKNVGWYFAIYAIVAIIVRLSGRVMDRVGFERTLMPSLVVLGIGLGLISETGRFGMLYVGAAIAGAGHGFVYPALSALVIRETKAGAMGRSSNVYTSVSDLSAMAGPYALGLIAGLFGYPSMFVIAGTLSIAGAIYMLAAMPHAIWRRLA
jgi:MFS family permease